MNKAIDITNVLIKTDRLIMRPWKQSDLADFYEYARVDGVGQMAGWMPHSSIEKSQEILSLFIEGKHDFALEYNGKVIGSLGIKEYNDENYPEFAALYGCEIGYVLSRAYWGQGLMPEAVKAVISWLFNIENVDFILCGHFIHNNQSKRVIEKCGFKYIRTGPYETRFNTIETCLEYILYRSDHIR